MEYRDLAKTEASESSADIRARVEAARLNRKHCQEGSSARSNAMLTVWHGRWLI